MWISSKIPTIPLHFAPFWSNNHWKWWKIFANFVQTWRKKCARPMKPPAWSIVKKKLMRQSFKNSWRKSRYEYKKRIKGYIVTNFFSFLKIKIFLYIFPSVWWKNGVENQGKRITENSLLDLWQGVLSSKTTRLQLFWPVWASIRCHR